MEDNPYVLFIQKICEQIKKMQPVNIRMGEVTSVGPLKLVVAGTVQTSEALLKNKALATLEIGDQLLLIPIEDEQRYIIVCKVVSV